MLVYVPLLTFAGVEGKTFAPMAFTVLIALASAFVLSLTFVPAMIAIVVTGRVQEKENLLIRALKVPYGPVLAAAIRAPLPVIAVAVFFVCRRDPAVRTSRPGVHAYSRREKHRDGG
jgi:cobalt-zinc-cadmium resistance protein CzcA